MPGVDPEEARQLAGWLRQWLKVLPPVSHDAVMIGRLLQVLEHTTHRSEQEGGR